jgi:hypothetical protein
MPTAVNDPVFEAWIDHPLVREAAYQAQKKRPHGGVAEFLESLSCVLAEFDERYPGLPYRTVLEAQSNPNLDPKALKDQMERAGVSAKDISLALGTAGWGGSVSPTVFRQIRDWPHARTWVDAGYTENQAYRMMRLRNPLTEIEKKALELLEDGWKIFTAAKHLGVSQETVRCARRKVEYRDWLARQ